MEPMEVCFGRRAEWQFSRHKKQQRMPLAQNQKLESFYLRRRSATCAARRETTP
jgi:hypothetical protein